MSLDPLQRRVASILKANRSDTSFVGGSSVFNKTFPRRSDDMDVYVHGTIGDVAQRDAASLRGHGLVVDLEDAFYGYCVEAVVKDGRSSTKIEWNEAERERFFPVRKDKEFGWTLHRADLAVQKLVAAASRRKARDAVDLALLDTLYAPLAVFAIAAPAKMGDIAPTAILDRALRNAIEHPQRDYENLALDRDAMPFEIGKVKMVLADKIAEAQSAIVERCREAQPGHLYVLRGTQTISLPTTETIERLDARGISERGSLPTIGAQAPSSWKGRDPYERG